MVTDSSLRVRPREGKATSRVSARNAQGPDANGNFRPDVYRGDCATGCHREFYPVGVEGYRCVKIVGLTQRTGGRNCTNG